METIDISHPLLTEREDLKFKVDMSLSDHVLYLETSKHQ